MKNIYPDKKLLQSIISDLRNGSYGIPDFQRDFEWNPRDVAELIKSIFENYYIGTLLLWKASRENIEYLSCTPIYGSKDDGKFQHIVLDGQQRLSALYYAFFAPKKNFPTRRSAYYYVIYLDKLLENNYDEAFDYITSSRKSDELIENEELQFEQKIFPLKVFGGKPHLWSLWLQHYKEYWEKKIEKEKAKEEYDAIEEIFDSTINEYHISCIELDQEIEVEKVCDIFQRINSTGLDLNIFDLMNALLRPKDIRLKSLWEKEIAGFQSKLPDTDKGKIYVLQTMSIMQQVYCAPKFLYHLIPNAVKLVKEGSGKFKKIVLIDSKDQFLKLWHESIDEMKNALKIITNHSDLGVIRAKFFPYPTMLPIFTAINIEKTKSIYVNRKDIEDKIRFWYWSSIFTKNYSSSVDTQMSKDFLEMKKWFLDDDAIPTVVSEARKVFSNIDLEREENQNSSIYKAIFCVLIREGALDFISYESPLYSELEDHHVVPKSWGNKNKVESINSILNRTPISDVTNKKVIRDILPNVYIKEMLKQAKKESDVYELFETHLISRNAVSILLRDKFGATDYQEFIKERKEAIIRKIKQLIGGQTELEKEIEENPNQALNLFETKIRDFIDQKLTKKCGADYWKQGIPGDVKANIDKRLEKEAKKNPFLDGVVSPRDKINYIDMAEYFSVIRYNWDIFEEYFSNRENSLIHFNNICDYRNPEKHARDKNNVVRKMGEASLEWVINIIEKKLKENLEPVGNHVDGMEGGKASATSEKIEKIFNDLRNKINGFDGVEEKNYKNSIKFLFKGKKKKFCSLYSMGKGKLEITIKIPNKNLDDPQKITEEYVKDRRYFYVTPESDIPYALHLIEQSYEFNKNK